MKQFGIKYKGSKDKIAIDIISQLPAGNRFVDLFGGGFAMSHCALLSNKYQKVLYNDINPLLPSLIQKAINGDYSYKVFKPKFISRDEFQANKDKDGYIKYIWSFGNNGRCYMYGRDIEDIKRKAHDFVVFGKLDKDLLSLLPELRQKVKSTDIEKRRLEFTRYASGVKKLRIQNLEVLKRLQDLEKIGCLNRIEDLENLKNLNNLNNLNNQKNLNKLSFANLDYRQYEYQQGDIVYCDIPYEATEDYGIKFDHKAFYDWAESCTYPVYFSSYPIRNDRFEIIWAKKHLSTLCAIDNNVISYECLYWNRR